MDSPAGDPEGSPDFFKEFLCLSEGFVSFPGGIPVVHIGVIGFPYWGVVRGGHLRGYTSGYRQGFPHDRPGCHVGMGVLPGGIVSGGNMPLIPLSTKVFKYSSN